MVCKDKGGKEGDVTYVEEVDIEWHRRTVHLLTVYKCSDCNFSCTSTPEKKRIIKRRRLKSILHYGVIMCHGSKRGRLHMRILTVTYVTSALFQSWRGNFVKWSWSCTTHFLLIFTGFNETKFLQCPPLFRYQLVNHAISNHLDALTQECPSLCCPSWKERITHDVFEDHCKICFPVWARRPLKKAAPGAEKSRKERFEKIVLQASIASRENGEKHSLQFIYGGSIWDL